MYTPWLKKTGFLLHFQITATRADIAADLLELCDNGAGSVFTTQCGYVQYCQKYVPCVHVWSDVIHGCCLSDFINTLITSNSGRFGRLKIYVVNLFCQVLVR